MKDIKKFLEKYWILDVILSTFPAIWFTILQIVGKQMNLVDASGNVTGLSLALFWIFVIFSFIYNGIKSWFTRNESESNKDGQILLREIISSVNSISCKRKDKILNVLRKYNQNGNLSNPFYKIENPKTNLSNLLEELSICLSKFTGLKREDIGLSIIYKFNNNDRWYSTKKNTSGNILDVINSNQSTAKQIIDNNTDIIMYLSKKEAEQHNRYIANSKDKLYELKGSIICVNISVSDNENRFINGVLNISTYSEPLIKNDITHSKDVLINVILKPFINKIQNEICIEYIKEIYSLNKANNKIQKEA